MSEETKKALVGFKQTVWFANTILKTYAPHDSEDPNAPLERNARAVKEYIRLYDGFVEAVNWFVQGLRRDHPDAQGLNPAFERAFYPHWTDGDQSGTSGYWFGVYNGTTQTWQETWFSWSALRYLTQQLKDRAIEFLGAENVTESLAEEVARNRQREQDAHDLAMTQQPATDGETGAKKTRKSRREKRPSRLFWRFYRY